eukprot:53700-Pyramimonas_sp.AAC.1
MPRTSWRRRRARSCRRGQFTRKRGPHLGGVLADALDEAGSDGRGVLQRGRAVHLNQPHLEGVVHAKVKPKELARPPPVHHLRKCNSHVGR